MRPAQAPTEPFSIALVKSVKPGPCVESFDIEVADVHEFYAGGLAVKNCTGNMHPHGSGSVESSIANMTQFEQRHPLVIGIGNFGWHDAKPAAARYTSCYLSPYARSMMDPSEMTQVPMDPTYDGKGVEPRYLPARLPHLLLYGYSSFSPGWSGCVPALTSEWVLDAVDRTVHGNDLVLPRRTSYRWGGILTELDKSWLRTGEGGARFVPEVRRESDRVLIVQLAPGLGAKRLAYVMEACADLGSVSEETAENDEHVRFVCTVRRGGSVEAVYRHAVDELRGSARYSMLYIRQFSSRYGVDYAPVTGSPGAFLRAWVKWRLKIVSGAALHRAEVHERDVLKLQLTIRAIEKRQLIVKALGAAKDRADLAQRVKTMLKCSDEEAGTIVDMQLYRFVHANIPGIREKIAEHKRQSKIERGIHLKPTARMMENASDTQRIAEELGGLNIEKPKERKRKSRHD